MSKCLVIGRTLTDMQECSLHGLPQHWPAPTTLIWRDWDKFDGDIITCHTIKFGAKWACAVEHSERVAMSSYRNPGRVVVGDSPFHPLTNAPKHLLDTAVLIKPPRKYPKQNSGIFALWWAFECGYKEIYTVGLDFAMVRGCKSIDETMEAALCYHQKEPLPTGVTYHCSNPEYIAEYVRLREYYPGQQVYKTSRFSRLPEPVKNPVGN